MEAEIKKTGRPMAVVRRFESESMAAAVWCAEASEILKLRLMDKDWTYKDLADALRDQGIKRSPAAVNRRINRTNFTAGFFLACLRAMNYKIDLRELEP
jgi:hypothetical protein